jgi:pyrimidine-nucleoside phosphorylase
VDKIPVGNRVFPVAITTALGDFRGVNFLALIEAKRDGHSLSEEAIRRVVAACTRGELPDYQLAAFLMAVYFKGLNPREITDLTLAMRDSGDRLTFPADPRPVVDKHSTGGVGDKVSLPLAPLLACLGFRVPMISGRGLGITGGTLDKLESIPGFTTGLSAQRIVEIVQTTGCVICGQTERMVPADRILYALRDVTGTVPSIPLIVASILSKKLAESLEALVLDVKFGAAAFMKTPEQARELARAMVDLGQACGTRTRALLTDMDTPLGEAAGNWLEVRETAACLDNRGPADLQELVLTCAAHLQVLTRKAPDLETGFARAREILRSGAARQKWEDMLAAQGANLEAYHLHLNRDQTASACAVVQAERSGFVTRCDARVIGEIVRELGGGRLTKDATVNPEVGIDQMAKPGATIQTGGVLARVHAAKSDSAEAAVKKLRLAFEISDAPPTPTLLITETIGN